MHKQAARELTENEGEYDSDGEEADGDDIPRSIAKAAKNFVIPSWRKHDKKPHPTMKACHTVISDCTATLSRAF